MEFELTDGRKTALKILTKVGICITAFTTGMILGNELKKAEKAIDRGTHIAFFKN